MKSARSGDHYTFLDFKLYPKQRTLLHDATPVAIGARAFDVLLLLLSQAGSVVRVNDLMQFVWPGITVEDANLRVQIGALRKILARSPDADQAIKTIPLRGYSFVLPVRYCAELRNVDPAGNVVRCTMPVLLSSIVGRDSAIDAIVTALQRHRLVTITGPGGIGKTAVAIAALERLAAHSDDQIAFAELSSVTDEANLNSTLACSLGADGPGATDNFLSATLNDRPWTLVLDTCEHIVDEVAKKAEMLLGQCKQLRILATSREALRAIGEWTYRLPCLHFPKSDHPIEPADLSQFSAIRMFLERAGISIQSELKPGDLQAVAEICRRLDGIPLALEFAAARVADLGLQKIAAHLDDCFKILTRGRRTALPRHRTLSATLDWSFGLLSNDERILLSHMATRSIPYIIGSHPKGTGCVTDDRIEVLSSLYHKSMLTVDMWDEMPVYRLLDTTRTYLKQERTRSNKPNPTTNHGLPSLSLGPLPMEQISSAQPLATTLLL
jgi:predicted ATPase/DNA-binding winged helix-turn-helix (wHTH) protein